MRHRLVHVLAPGEQADVAHGAVRDVEQPHLHQLVRANVRDEQRANLLPRRPLAVHEVILDDPVFVRLAHHRPLVPSPDLLLELVEVRGRRRGGDAVHHRARVARLELQPANQRLVEVEVAGRAQDALLRHLAVVGEVVAGHDRERALPRAVPRRERREAEAEDGEPVSRIRGEALALGIRAEVVEPPGESVAHERVVALGEGHPVPELGDGEGDDLDVVGGEESHRRRRVLEG